MKQYRRADSYATLRRYDRQLCVTYQALTDPMQIMYATWDDYFVNADGTEWLMSNAPLQDIYEAWQSDPEMTPENPLYYPPGTLDGITIVELDQTTVEGVPGTPGTNIRVNSDEKNVIDTPPFI